MMFGKRLSPGGMIMAAMLLVTMICIMPIVLGGCGSSTSCPTCSSSSSSDNVVNPTPITTSKTIVASVIAQQGADDSVMNFFTDKGVATSATQFKGMIDAMPKDETKGIEIKLIPTGADPKNPAAYVDPSRVWIPIPWTCYGLVINWHKHYVGSCIHRDVWHLNFQVQNRCNGTMIFDSHACGWWENGPQFGLYVTPSGWCGTTRGGYSGVKDTLRNALLAAGFGYTSAVVISNVGAPVVAGALGF